MDTTSQNVGASSNAEHDKNKPSAPAVAQPTTPTAPAKVEPTPAEPAKKV